MQFIPDPRFEEVKEFIRSGEFGSSDYDELLGSLEGEEGFGRADYFLVGKDFPSYIECQEKVDEAYRDQKVCHAILFFIITLKLASWAKLKMFFKRKSHWGVYCSSLLGCEGYNSSREDF